ncbi:nuclear transport factor 2 family protein [Sphingomonas ginsenosidivorax]|uniref:Nuclear transport factor 2 family protein n=1 Tax=Sphingomonas ginsenosidivorax TaxID=862135 RepID=A0A5C6UBK2_9SPHN|nr:nuclear transport factor 2 family protein [Sphingomonas ginsenosidivorax]TXC70227.1 nuclear transport factor 2 family protein [Sphingomonas ginsenosidivorax]
MTDFVTADCGIRQLHARFADAVWRQDATSFADCFAPDGVWKIAGMVLIGRDEIGRACGPLLGRCERIQLVTGQPILEVGDGSAIGRLQMTEFAKKRDGTTALTFGTYHDRYVEHDGAWCFAWRHWTMAYHGPVDMSGPYVTPPDYGAFPGMPEADEPTYVRPA